MKTTCSSTHIEKEKLRDKSEKNENRSLSPRTRREIERLSKIHKGNCYDVFEDVWKMNMQWKPLSVWWRIMVFNGIFTNMINIQCWLFVDTMQKQVHASFQEASRRSLKNVSVSMLQGERKWQRPWNTIFGSFSAHWTSPASTNAHERLRWGRRHLIIIFHTLQIDIEE